MKIDLDAQKKRCNNYLQVTWKWAKLAWFYILNMKIWNHWDKPICAELKDWNKIKERIKKWDFFLIAK